MAGTVVTSPLSSPVGSKPYLAKKPYRSPLVHLPGAGLSLPLQVRTSLESPKPSSHIPVGAERASLPLLSQQRTPGFVAHPFTVMVSPGGVIYTNHALLSPTQTLKAISLPATIVTPLANAARTLLATTAHQNLTIQTEEPMMTRTRGRSGLGIEDTQILTKTLELISAKIQAADEMMETESATTASPTNDPHDDAAVAMDLMVALYVLNRVEEQRSVSRKEADKRANEALLTERASRRRQEARKQEAKQLAAEKMEDKLLWKLLMTKRTDRLEALQLFLEDRVQSLMGRIGRVKQLVAALESLPTSHQSGLLTQLLTSLRQDNAGVDITKQQANRRTSPSSVIGNSHN